MEVEMIADVVVRPAGQKGQGVFALRDFRASEFLFRRRHGRIIRNEEIETLSADDQRHLCEIDWERSAVLLAPGCYLNHACDPNAMRTGVKVFAWTSIRQGQEITIDYRLNAFTNERWKCICGSPNCQGSVTSSFFSLSEDRQAAYLPYAPRFIQREYRQRQGQAHAKRHRAEP